MSAKEEFTSRWGLIASVIGIAVGTGNIWRFPRIVAANGGGAFLVPWVCFLFLWSIPLIIAEFAIGKGTRFGPAGAVGVMMGRRFTWMGAFVALVSSAIMFYYSVVTGWCMRYFLAAATGQLFEVQDHSAFWAAFIGSQWQPVLFHVAAITTAIIIVQRGVVRGIERANRILVPGLLLLIIVSALRAVTLPGASQGLEYLFTPDLASLANAGIWIQALTQNAWDTGAGWGLILTYAVYMRQKEDVPLNAALIGLGNNSVSLLAAITVFSTVFAIIPEEAGSVLRTTGPANTGLTFIWIPQLFSRMPWGNLFSSFFFLALSFAAFSSLIAMTEMSARILMDLKLSRVLALRIVWGVALLLGLPSALSIDFFLNQDWVWGVGLMLSGLFIALAVISYGAERFRQNMVNSQGSDLQVGRWYNLLIRFAIPVQVVVLISWWFYQVISADPEHWWDPFATESVGTCLLQWSIAMAALILANRFISERTLKE